MRVKVIVMTDHIPDLMIRRAIEHLERRFSGDLPLIWAAPAEAQSRIGDFLAPRPLELYQPAAFEKDADILIYVGMFKFQHDGTLWRPEQRVYYFNTIPYNCGGRYSLQPIQPESYDTFNHPHIESHIFNRLSARNWGFVNFPYGCLYMDPDSGPVDPFGFRIAQDWRLLRERNADHKVVAVFGGSAAFSCYCAYDEMFAARLEDKLNRRAQEKGSKTRFTVLNFGMHDNVVMQEMLTYMLHVYSLKPDVIIAHDGHNDLWYGLCDDPLLVNHYDIIYQRHSEMWSKKLHETEDLPIPPMFSTSADMQELNLPQKVIRAYVTRKRQFQDIAERHGAIFIWGLQPTILSKPRLSFNENLVIESMPQFRRCERPEEIFFTKLFQAYELLAATLRAMPDIKLADFHAHMSQFGEDKEIMWDHIHLSPLGDDILAEKYLEILTRHGSESWQI